LDLLQSIAQQARGILHLHGPVLCRLKEASSGSDVQVCLQQILNHAMLVLPPLCTQVYKLNPDALSDAMAVVTDVILNTRSDNPLGFLQALPLLDPFLLGELSPTVTRKHCKKMCKALKEFDNLKVSRVLESLETRKGSMFVHLAAHVAKTCLASRNVLDVKCRGIVLFSARRNTGCYTNCFALL